MSEENDRLSKAAIRRRERAARANKTFYIHGISEIPTFTISNTDEVKNKPTIRKKVTKRKLAPQPRPSKPKKTLHIAPRPQPSIFEIIPATKHVNKPAKIATKKRARVQPKQARVNRTNLVSAHSARILIRYALGNSEEAIKQKLNLGDRAIAKTFERLTGAVSKKLNIPKPNVTRSKLFIYLIENGHIDLSEFEKNIEPSTKKLAKRTDPENLNVLILQAQGLTESEISNFLGIKVTEIRKRNAELRKTFNVATKEAVFVIHLMSGVLPKTSAEIEILANSIEIHERTIDVTNRSNLDVTLKETFSLSKLNAMQRQILVFIVQGYSSEEIGEMMIIQRGTVNAARHKIKQLLGSRSLATGIIEMIKKQDLIIRFDKEANMPAVDVASFNNEELNLLNSIVDLSFFELPTARRKSHEERLMSSLVSKLRIREIYNVRQIPNHEHCLVIEGMRNGVLSLFDIKYDTFKSNGPQL